MNEDDKFIMPKVSKSIVERRRRARINQHLEELKHLILQPDPDRSNHSKLEKANILQMTVEHLKQLRRHHKQAELGADSTAGSPFSAGFQSCASEVRRFVMLSQTADANIKVRLLDYLAHLVTVRPMLQTPPDQTLPDTQPQQGKTAASSANKDSDPSTACQPALFPLSKAKSCVPFRNLPYMWRTPSQVSSAGIAPPVWVNCSTGAVLVPMLVPTPGISCMPGNPVTPMMQPSFP